MGGDVVVGGDVGVSVELVGGDAGLGWGEFAASVAGGASVVDPSAEWVQRVGGRPVVDERGVQRWGVELLAEVRGRAVQVVAGWHPQLVGRLGAQRVVVTVAGGVDDEVLAWARGVLVAGVAGRWVAQGVVHTPVTRDAWCGPYRCAGVGVGAWTWLGGADPASVVWAGVQSERVPVWVAASGRGAVSSWPVVEVSVAESLAGGALFACAEERTVDLAERLAVAGVWVPVGVDRQAYLWGGDGEYRSQVAYGLPEAQAGGLGYVVDHPDGSEVVFHGFFWRDAQGRRVEPEGRPEGSVMVFVTALGGVLDVVHAPLDRVVAEGVWVDEVRRQVQVVPGGGVNEWHTDHGYLAWLWGVLFERVGVDVRVVHTELGG